MLEAITLFLALASLGVSFVFGIKWRRENNNLIKEMIKSKQNISMGIMSLLIALYFCFNITSFTFNLRLVVTIAMFAIGFLNTVQGVRMYRHYIKQLPAKT